MQKRLLDYLKYNNAVCSINNYTPVPALSLGLLIEVIIICVGTYIRLVMFDAVLPDFFLILSLTDLYINAPQFMMAPSNSQQVVNGLRICLSAAVSINRHIYPLLVTILGNCLSPLTIWYGTFAVIALLIILSPKINQHPLLNAKRVRISSVVSFILVVALAT